MYCKQCGSQMREGATFCAECGASVNAQPTVNRPVSGKAQVSGFSLDSVKGILSNMGMLTWYIGAAVCMLFSFIFFMANNIKLSVVGYSQAAKILDYYAADDMGFVKVFSIIFFVAGILYFAALIPLKLVNKRSKVELPTLSVVWNAFWLIVGTAILNNEAGNYGTVSLTFSGWMCVLFSIATLVIAVIITRKTKSCEKAGIIAFVKKLINK